MLRGPEKTDKKDGVWSFHSVPNYVIIILKINNFKDNKSRPSTIIRHSFLQYKCICASCTKVDTFTFYKASLGVIAPQKAKKLKKKIKQNGGFSIKVRFL